MLCILPKPSSMCYLFHSTSALNMAIYGELYSSLRYMQEYSNGEVLVQINFIANDDVPVYLREAYLLARNQRLDW